MKKELGTQQEELNLKLVSRQARTHGIVRNAIDPVQHLRINTILVCSHPQHSRMVLIELSVIYLK